MNAQSREERRCGQRQLVDAHLPGGVHAPLVVVRGLHGASLQEFRTVLVVDLEEVVEGAGLGDVCARLCDGQRVVPEFSANGGGGVAISG